MRDEDGIETEDSKQVQWREGIHQGVTELVVMDWAVFCESHFRDRRMQVDGQISAKNLPAALWPDRTRPEPSSTPQSAAQPEEVPSRLAEPEKKAGKFQTFARLGLVIDKVVIAGENSVCCVAACR